MANWVGFAVSVNCGETLGCYQGTIADANGSTITLRKAFRNGFPYPKDQVTLNASDIKELKIIEEANKAEGQSQSTVAVVKSKKGQKTTVCENLQASRGSEEVLSVNARKNTDNGPPRSKPIDIQNQKNSRINNANNQQCSRSTERSRAFAERVRRKNEACFGGDVVQSAMATEFDFEKNLLLFDKRALWKELSSECPSVGNGANSSKPPDVVACCRVARAERAVRERLWEGIRSRGLFQVTISLFARGVAELCLKLLSDIQHLHPTVLVMADHTRVGLCGVLSACMLDSLGIRTRVCLSDGRPLSCQQSCGDISLWNRFAECSYGSVVSLSRALELRPHLVLLADERSVWPHSGSLVVRVDGCGEGEAAACAWAMCAGPNASPSDQEWLVNVCAPASLFASVGLPAPSFGSLSLLPLEPINEDDIF